VRRELIQDAYNFLTPNQTSVYITPETNIFLGQEEAPQSHYYPIHLQTSCSTSNKQTILKMKMMSRHIKTLFELENTCTERPKILGCLWNNTIKKLHNSKRVYSYEPKMFRKTLDILTNKKTLNFLITWITILSTGSASIETSKNTRTFFSRPIT